MGTIFSAQPQPEAVADADADADAVRAKSAQDKYQATNEAEAYTINMQPQADADEHEHSHSHSHPPPHSALNQSTVIGASNDSFSSLSPANQPQFVSTSTTPLLPSTTVTTTTQSLPPYPTTPQPWWYDSLKSIHLTPNLLLSSTPPFHSSYQFPFLNSDVDASWILNNCIDIQMIRYKIVPARISEQNFWRNLFFILYTSTLLRTQYTDDSLRDENARLHEELKKHENNIMKLETQLQYYRNMNMNMNLSHLTSVPNSTSTTASHDQFCAKCKQSLNEVPASSRHAGEWKLDKHAQEFFSLEPALRDNLRAEKRKRLAAVNKELAWVFDSDDIADATGSWSCCGGTEYNGNGCTGKR